MTCGMQIVLKLVCLVALFAPSQSANASSEQWSPLSDESLIVPAGGVLDFSRLLEPGPAGQHGWAQVLPDGHIGFQRRRAAQRFLGVSLALSNLHGGIPDHDGSIQLVEQLRRTGYNLVRLHFVDAQLMSGRNRDFDFDPVQFDRLHYLLAELAHGGIYWLVDGLTSDNAAWGNVKPHRWTKKHRAKLDLLTTEAGFQHWAMLVQRLWGARNPYTGISPLNDPAMLGLILVNEGSLGYLATIDGNRYPDALRPEFQRWLQARYGNDVALRAAWRAELRRDESLATQVQLPTAIRGRNARDVDFARFVIDAERKAYGRMDAYVRTLGFGGLTTAYDNWGFVNADITRKSLAWVDMHSYHVSPSNHGQPGSRIAQTSVHGNMARYVRELTNARQWGKPFTVSEYSQPFWNKWRHESAVLLPAVAALQDWDAICQFAEAPIQSDYGPSPFVRRQAIYPYGIGADPIARAGERLAALLYKRGDVAPARGRIRLHLDAERALTRSGGWEQVPESLSRLGLVSAIGLEFGPLPDRSKSGELAVDLTSAPVWWSKLESSLVKAGINALASDMDPLRGAGVVGPKNLSRPQDRLYQSDTEQLTVDSSTGRIALVTDRSEVLVIREGSAGVAGGLSVHEPNAPVLVAVSSLDTLPVRRSRRLLLWVLTDATNSGMTFEDDERTTIRTLGGFPPKVRTVGLTIRIEHDNAARLRVWPLSLAGERRAPLNLSASNNRAVLKLDTAVLPDGPALLYELAFE